MTKIPSDSGLMAGFGKVDITPYIGIRLGGYARRTGESKTVGERLYSRAVAIHSQNSIIILITNDLLSIPSHLCQEVRNKISRSTGISKDNILICATHTHGGPLLEHMSMMEEEIIDDKWIEEVLVQNIAEAGIIAFSQMSPALISIGMGRIPGLTYNRRLKGANGNVETHYVLFKDNKPVSLDGLEFGPVDPEICLLVVHGEASQLMGLILNFSCHPACNDFGLDVISADFPGLITKRLETTLGIKCLYTSAPCAEIVPALRNSYFMTSVLNNEVLQLLKELKLCQCNTIEIKRLKIKLPLKNFLPTPDSRDHFEQEMATNSDDRFLARRLLLYAEKYQGCDSLETEIQSIDFGNFIFLGLPGEISVEIGLKLKRLLHKHLGNKMLFIITLANDWIGELISDKAYQEGGNEPKTTRLGVGSEDALMQGIQRMLIKKPIAN